MRKGKIKNQNKAIPANERELVGEIVRDAASQPLEGPTLELFRRWIVDEDKAGLKDEALKGEFDAKWKENLDPGEDSYELLAQMWRRLGLDDSEFPERGVRGAAAMAAEGGTRRPAGGNGLRRTWLRPAMRVAAVLLPIAIAVCGVWYVMREPGGQVSPQGALQVAEVVMAVPDTLGAQGRTSLADGSSVLIRPGSRIAYAEDFGSEDIRRVKLSGEAYFDVEKDAARKFVVETSSLRVTVLGTTFNVQAAEGGTHTVVSLYTGRVTIESAAAGKASGNDGAAGTVTMEPGHRLTWDNATGRYGIEKIDSALPDWITARLTFKQASLGEVLRAFEWYYGVPIEVTGRIRQDDQYTFVARGTDGLDKAIDLLELMAPGMRLTNDGDTLRMERKTMRK